MHERPDELVLRALRPTVAFVFDFDETLAERTTDALLRHLGVDPDDFAERHVRPRTDDGWEKRLAEARGLVELSNTDLGPVTLETFRSVARSLDLYPGVEGMFDRVADAVHAVAEGITVEFHLLTAGFVEIPSATSIADRFDSIRGGRWAFDDQGRIIGPRTTLGHWAKVRHLKALAKGLPSTAADRERDVDAPIPEHEWHVPYEQIVFVGDGDSDLPAFDFVQSTAGTAIAVYQAEDDGDWESRTEMRDGRQVDALLPSDFTPESPLSRALELAGRRAALRIELLRLGR